MTSIKVHTKDLYRNYVASATEIFWDSSRDLAPEVAFNLPLLVAFTKGNFDPILKEFRGGSTPLLLSGEDMAKVEAVLDGKTNETMTDEVEIRVYHEGKIIGVVVDKDINY